jgi:hypothetical protein
MEQPLKGKEMKMPKGLFFTDKDGTLRTQIRIRWWEYPAEMTFKSISIEPLDNLPEQAIDVKELTSTEFYGREDKKVFFGHYWLSVILQRKYLLLRL